MNKLSRDQRRRKKLADRQKRPKLAPRPNLALRPNLAPRLDRNRIAEAVHGAVCEYTGTDGFGHCAMYAVGGMGLLWNLGLKQVCVQVGGLYLQPDPDDPTAWITMDPVNGWGEVHAWLAHWKKPSVPGVHPVASDMEFIDFSARHYKRYVEEMPSIIAPGIAPVEKLWRQSEAPTYLWATKDDLPKWIRLTPRKEQTQELMNDARDHLELVRLACQEYRQKLGFSAPHN